MVTRTSSEAMKLKTRILSTMKATRFRYTTRRLSTVLNACPNAVRGRVSELVKAGALTRVGSSSNDPNAGEYVAT